MSDLKSQLISRYRELPSTGLYDIYLPYEEQCMMFLKYVQYLKDKLYDGPRNIELRRLTEIVKHTYESRQKETLRLYELLNIDHENIDFEPLLEASETASDVKYAGENYRQYIKYYRKAISDPYDDQMIQKIKTNLLKKYSLLETDKRIEEILESHKKMQADSLIISEQFKEIMQSDPKYLKWSEIQTLLQSLGFDVLSKLYKDLDMTIGCIRRENGISLETVCIDKILTIISERTHIDISDLNVIRNIKLKISKTLIGEIDIIITHKNKIIACIEVKSGIYDIPYAIMQINKIKSYIHNINISFVVDYKETIFSISDDPIYLVITTISPHKPITGASYSDVQLICNALFKDPDKKLLEFLRKKTHTQTDMIAIYNIIHNIRKQMDCHIDVYEAISILGDDLIVI